jgi:hypothetical protein
MTATTENPAPAHNPATVRIEQIPARQLMVDHAVQRPLDTTRAERIANSFDPNALGTFVVSRRADGTYHLIDGQHRHAVVILLGHEDWLLNCQVYTGLTTQEEARMFRLLNNSKAVNVIEKFLVRIQEEDPVAVKINDVMADKGWKISTSKIDANFCAVAAVEKPYRRAEAKHAGDGETLVAWLMDVVTKAWGFAADGVRAEIISGLSLVWLRHSEAIDTKKLIDELTVIPGGARGMVGRAKSLRDFRKGTIGDAMAELIINMLNNKRRINRLPAWRDDDPTVADG